MTESGLEPVEGGGAVFRDVGDPDAGRRKIRLISAARIVAVLALLLASCIAGASESADEPVSAQPAAIESWPAGTRLLIPNRIMEEFQRESDSWTYPSVYLFANYFITAPSLRNRRKETVYIPLAKETAGRAKGKEVMMDIMNIRRISDNPSVFATIGRLHVIPMCLYGKDYFVGASVED